MKDEYVIYMGMEQKKYFDALIAHQFNPTEETKKVLDRLSEENTKRLIEGQAKKEIEFIAMYGQSLFDFVKSISKEYFLYSQNSPFYLSWDVRADYDNDDYWVIRFSKEKFKYVQDTCSGYGETIILEENISQERVLELLNENKEQ